MSGREQYFQCRLEVTSILGVGSRLLPGTTLSAPKAQALVVTESGEFLPLEGGDTDAHGPLRLGPPLELLSTTSPKDPEPQLMPPAQQEFPQGQHNSPRRSPRAAAPALSRWRPCSDVPYSYVAANPVDGSFFCLEGFSVLRVSGADLVERVAGDMYEDSGGDGPGSEASFRVPHFLTCDSYGTLYLADGPEVRAVYTGAQAVEAAARARAQPANGDGGGEDPPSYVSTLPFQADMDIWGLAYDPCAHALVFASKTALYRWALERRGQAQGQGQEQEERREEGQEQAGPGAPVLFAGREGRVGGADGRGAQARFRDIRGLAADACGCVYVVEGEGSPYEDEDDEDEDEQEETTAVRRVAPDGSVTTLVAGLAGEWDRPAVLPNGCLALCCYAENALMLLDLRLRPLPLCAPAANAGAHPARSLPSDLGALLDGEAEGTSDLTITVADRRFAVHRLILSARCDYFKQRLTGHFADGAATELSLPDADPAAFELLLRFVYTGRADIPPALAQSVAELADRLLLPELCRAAQGVMLAGVTAESVVDSLLWAERHGGIFSHLHAGLRAWYLQHQVEVLEHARESLERLSAESPRLMVELLAEGLGQWSPLKERRR
ncbi:hypothetical protein HYH03_001997 [Edaphochlamys debaryana]|uniref:BTB domain-containing protein n=1 Tax=Edaphochlamys debaryana TaxID=47281 RepID=A0A836C5U6_9CHLO|nr:hypothetical protein HYH03_001997 [Edaphochlamys debaryana]|eukprot:KAG2500428.1 hypothetical protein HYH03_001997 [Edaphochlamys debaryana]